MEGNGQPHAYPIEQRPLPEGTMVQSGPRAQSEGVTEPTALHQFSQAVADLVAAARSGLVLPHPTRVPVTGVVWATDRVLTVAHGMGARDEGQVVLPDGTIAAAKILGRDPTLDLALLEVPGATPGTLAWGETSDARAGELAVVVGLRPVLVDGEVEAVPLSSLGLVSAVAGPWRTRAGARVARRLEVDATLPPGASGGVLVSTDGRLLGLNTHGLSRGGATLPVETLREAVARLEAGGSVKPGFLGVGVQPARIRGGDETQGEASGRVGVLINAVRPDSPAARGGLLVGDVVLSIDGESVASYRDLRAILLGRGGQSVTVELHRAGAEHRVEVEVGVREGAPGFPGPRRGGRRHARGRGGDPLAN